MSADHITDEQMEQLARILRRISLERECSDENWKVCRESWLKSAHQLIHELPTISLRVALF